MACTKCSSCNKSKFAILYRAYYSFLLPYKYEILGVILGLVVLYFILKTLLQMGGYKFGRKSGVKISLEDRESYRKGESFTGRKITFIDPRSNESLGEENSATPEEVEAVVRRAAAAQVEWAKTSFKERRAVLTDLIEYILINKDDICKASVRDTGKTLLEAELGEIIVTLEKMRYICNKGEKVLSPSYRDVPMAFFYRTARVEYHPLGVIAAIIPWNYPAHSAFSPTVAALFCGNAIVVKVSEYSSYSRLYLQAIVRHVLVSRGHNPDLVSFIPGYGDTGKALCEAPGISKLLFIGSAPTGKRVMEACSKNLVPVTLELGGKDPFIVMPDAEVEWAAQVAVRGSFINCGQNCIASERIFVHESLLDKFTNVVKIIAEKTTQGNFDSDWGCMSVDMQISKIQALLSDAVSKGAKILLGGKRKEQGLYFEPTILTNVNETMLITKEETFGPVMLIISWKDEEQLLKMVNGTEYGLGCSVFSKNQSKAEELARKVVCGMAVINDFGLPYLQQDAPFGGCKASGFGRFNGPEGLFEFSRPQSILGERFWVPTSIKGPRLVSYPILPIAPYAVGHAMTIFYGWGLWTKFKAVLGLLKLFVVPPKKKED